MPKRKAPKPKPAKKAGRGKAKTVSEVSIDSLAEAIWIGMKVTTAFPYPAYRDVKEETREALRNGANFALSELGIKITPPRN